MASLLGGGAAMAALYHYGPALKTLAIAVGTGAAEMPGRLASESLSEKLREYMGWRPGADGNSLRDQIAQEGLQAALDHLTQFDSAGNDGQRMEELGQAKNALIRAKDRLSQADIIADETMFLHCVKVHNLLILVSYLHMSELGRNERAGWLAARGFLQNLFRLFHRRLMACRAVWDLPGSGKAQKLERLKADYSQHLGVWVERLHAIVAQGGRLTVTLSECNDTQITLQNGSLAKMVIGAQINYLPSTEEFRPCPTCYVGYVLESAGSCSNHHCTAFIPPITATATQSGAVDVQTNGKGEFSPRYVELVADKLTLYSPDRARVLASVSIPRGEVVRVSDPKSARPGRPDCLRVDLPEPDSSGNSKYILDPKDAVTKQAWKEALGGICYLTHYTIGGGAPRAAAVGGAVVGGGGGGGAPPVVLQLHHPPPPPHGHSAAALAVAHTPVPSVGASAAGGALASSLMYSHVTIPEGIPPGAGGGGAAPLWQSAAAGGGGGGGGAAAAAAAAPLWQSAAAGGGGGGGGGAAPVWQWQNDHGWTGYHPVLAERLEAAYLASVASGGFATAIPAVVEFRGDGDHVWRCEKRHFLRYLYIKNEHFTKTGSGQT
jgi:hypothetical protein